MSALDVLLLLLIGALAVFAVRRICKGRGGCGGCCASCARRCVHRPDGSNENSRGQETANLRPCPCDSRSAVVKNKIFEK